MPKTRKPRLTDEQKAVCRIWLIKNASYVESATMADIGTNLETLLEIPPGSIAISAVRSMLEDTVRARQADTALATDVLPADTAETAPVHQRKPGRPKKKPAAKVVRTEEPPKKPATAKPETNGHTPAVNVREVIKQICQEVCEDVVNEKLQELFR